MGEAEKHQVPFAAEVVAGKRVAMLIEQREITFPEIPELLNELNLFEVEQTKAGNMRYNAPEGYHDDIVISMALAVDGLAKQKEHHPMAMI